MDREQLKQWLDEGLSLEQIGEIVDRHPSTVGYWLKKHGLVANGQDKHAARGGLTRDQLEPLVMKGITHREIAKALDRSVSTVRHWIRQHDLPEPRQVRRASLDEALAAGNGTIVRWCRWHGETEFVLVTSGPRRLRCKRCRSEAVQRRRRKVKRILVAEAGGECSICGYDRCVQALEFHHHDPATKRFGLSSRGITMGLDRLRHEASKCVLLCANCHAEVEAGVTELPVKLGAVSTDPG